MRLLLNLGHNSAAIGVNDSQVVGYEEERLTRKKSTSAFPIHAIQQVFANMEEGEFREAYIAHWFDNLSFHKAPSSRISKYYDADAVNKLKRDGYKLHFLSNDVTHHTAHAWSAVSFLENHAEGIWPGAHVIVADGFGNGQEVLSVYRMERRNDSVHLHCRFKAYGYKQSLGLMYQYATSYVGMTEHQDEYKLLGYETQLFKLEPHVVEREIIHDMAIGFGARMFNAMLNSRPVKVSSTYVNEDELTDAKRHFWQVYDAVLRASGASQNLSRPVIGYFVQTALEHCYTLLIQSLGYVSDVLLTGGVHYNVKLNNLVAKLVNGRVCVVPLAGDQGVGIGLYRACGHLFPFKDLTWGARDLSLVGSSLPKDAHFCVDPEHYVETVTELLRQNRLVNTITGRMEFGPRALCNTSTLAIATEENVDAINKLNGRDTVMPFAGVMLEANAPYLHEERDVKRVVGSLYYMITTLDLRCGPSADNGVYAGIMHQYPGKERWSGRPQLVPSTSAAPIRRVLEAIQGDFKAIINTSLNVHGVPIVYSVKDALADYSVNLSLAETHGLRPPAFVIGAF